MADKEYARDESNVEVWANTIPYLQMLAQTDWEVRNACKIGDVPDMMRSVDILYKLLKRTAKQGTSDKKDLFFKQVKGWITEAHDNYAKSLSRGSISRQDRTYVQDLQRESYRLANNAWEALGDYMFEEGLTFKKDVEASELWRRG